MTRHESIVESKKHWRCLICSKVSPPDRRHPSRKRKYCSTKCYGLSLRDKRGAKSPMWKGENISVGRIHQWLREEYGTPSVCEGKDCKGTSDVFDWALKRGKTHKRRRTHYLRLCRSCHKKYDWDESKLLHAMKNFCWVTKTKRKGYKDPASWK